MVLHFEMKPCRIKWLAWKVDPKTRGGVKEIENVEEFRKHSLRKTESLRS